MLWDVKGARGETPKDWLSCRAAGWRITGRCVACPAELVEAIIEMEPGWEPYAYLPRCRGAHAN